MEKALWPPKAERATVIRNNELVVSKDGNLRSERCPHEDSLRLNIIHTVYIDIYINYNNYSIKNYYVNSYLTTCMAQSIKLVSCNNNNKDTTIYLLVSLSSFDSHRLLLCSNLLVYTSFFLFFFFLLFPPFSLPTITLLLHVPMHTSLHSILFTDDRKDWKFQISIGINHFFFSPLSL